MHGDSKLFLVQNNELRKQEPDSKFLVHNTPICNQQTLMKKFEAIIIIWEGTQKLICRMRMRRLRNATRPGVPATRDDGKKPAE